MSEAALARESKIALMMVFLLVGLLIGWGFAVVTWGYVALIAPAVTLAIGSLITLGVRDTGLKARLASRISHRLEKRPS